MEQTFPDFIVHERDRLKTERENIFSQQQELETKLADINRELAAIDAYEAAKSGKQTSPPRTRAVARPAAGRRSGYPGPCVRSRPKRSRQHSRR